MLLSLGVLGATVALVMLLDLVLEARGVPEDPLMLLWHRYDEGDLASKEFERLKRAKSLPCTWQQTEKK